MFFILWVMMVFPPAIDSISSQSEPYQGLEYELTNLDFKATFDPTTGDIYLFNNQDRSLVTISEAGNVDTLATLPGTFEGLDKMDITHSGESIYFWENGIGRVHRYDVTTGNMTREDTSHQHRTMFRHAPFLSDDNYIYAIGGYGYWEMRNFLIRYEPEFGQWEKVPSKNDDIVIRDWSGLLYKIGDTFYYFIDDTQSEEFNKTHVYRFEVETGMWHREQDLEYIFKNFSIEGRFVTRPFGHNTTRMIDENNRHLGFLSASGNGGFLNLVSLMEPAVYQLNLTSIGIHNVRAAFYSHRIDKWVILGHEYPMSERTRLKAYLFEFDENHPFITVHEPDPALPSEAMFLTVGGVFAAALIGFFLYFFLKTNRSVNDGHTTGVDDSSKKPVEISKSDDGGLSVFIDGKRFKMSEDKAMKELWTIIAEQVETGEPSMLVSNIDQRIYSNQSHPSYNSRNRKKLVDIINTTCGFNLISEERSKIDKRYKVLTIKFDKIRLYTD